MPDHEVKLLFSIYLLLTMDSNRFAISNLLVFFSCVSYDIVAGRLSFTGWCVVCSGFLGLIGVAQWSSEGKGKGTGCDKAVIYMFLLKLL